MDPVFTLSLIALSVLSSALGGMLGMAGGIFLIPALTIWAHIDIHAAAGASLVSVISSSCGAAGPYLKARLTNIRLAILLETATTLGALTGVFLATIVSGRFLFVLFAGILLLSAWQMANRRKEVEVIAPVIRSGRFIHKLALDSSYPDSRLGVEVPYAIQRLPLGWSLMYAAGIISALLGIGSGVLKIPAMDSALRLPIKVSSATSNFMIAVTAAASAGVYFLRGELSIPLAAPVAVGSVLGSIVGAKILIRVSNEKIRLLFVIVLLGLAIQMGWKGLNGLWMGGA